MVCRLTEQQYESALDLVIQDVRHNSRVSACVRSSTFFLPSRKPVYAHYIPVGDETWFDKIFEEHSYYEPRFLVRQAQAETFKKLRTLTFLVPHDISTTRCEAAAILLGCDAEEYVDQNTTIYRCITGDCMVSETGKPVRLHQAWPDVLAELDACRDRLRTLESGSVV